MQNDKATTIRVRQQTVAGEVIVETEVEVTATYGAKGQALDVFDKVRAKAMADIPSVDGRAMADIPSDHDAE